MREAQHLEVFVEERDVARIEEFAAGRWLCAGLLAPLNPGNMGHSGGAYVLGLNTVRDVEYHVGVTNLEYRVPVAGLQESTSFPHSSNHQSQPGIEPGTLTSGSKGLDHSAASGALCFKGWDWYLRSST